MDGLEAALADLAALQESTASGFGASVEFAR